MRASPVAMAKLVIPRAKAVASIVAAASQRAMTSHVQLPQCLLAVDLTTVYHCPRAASQPALSTLSVRVRESMYAS